MRYLFWRLHLGTRLRTKAFMPVALLLAILIGVSAVTVYDTMRAEITRDYEQRMQPAWQQLVAAIEEDDLLNQPSRLERRLKRTAHYFPAILDVSIYVDQDDAYRVLASSDPSRVGDSAGEREREALASERPLWSEVAHDGDSALKYNVPLRLKGGSAAVLGMVVSLADRQHKLGTLLRGTVAIALTVFIALFGLIYTLHRYLILRPLHRLERAFDELADGNLEVRIDESRALQQSPPQRGSITVRDEFAHIMNSFNDMADRLVGQQARLREQNLRDELTGLHNRRYFDEIIDREIARARRHDQPFAVALADVDNLREVNNGFGHLEGDQLLRDAAEFLQGHIRASDELIRWGGDEFLILMPEHTKDEAERVVDRLTRALEDWNDRHERKWTLSLSMGAASWLPGEDIDEVLHRADARMYEAKAKRK